MEGNTDDRVTQWIIIYTIQENGEHLYYGPFDGQNASGDSNYGLIKRLAEDKRPDGTTYRLAILQSGKWLAMSDEERDKYTRKYIKSLPPKKRKQFIEGLKKGELKSSIEDIVDDYVSSDPLNLSAGGSDAK